MSRKVASELESLASATEVLSPNRFRLFGQVVELPSGSPEGPLSSDQGVEADRDLLLARRLTEALYWRWYTRPLSPRGGGGFLERREHVDRLARANSGRGTFQPGWTFARVEESGLCAVEKDGLVYHAPRSLVRSDEGEIEAGAECRVWVPPELRELQHGFYVALGDADQAPLGEVPYQLRLYWNLRAPGAPLWMRILTTELNRSEIPFSLKVPSGPEHYRRADAGVLFLEPDDYLRVRPMLREAYRELRDQLRPEVPRLTARLAPGLGLAEGPPDGSSFGLHRCGLIARGLVEAFEAHSHSPAQRLAAVSRAFELAGFDPERPYLASGSSSRYRPLPASDLDAEGSGRVDLPDEPTGGRNSRTSARWSEPRANHSSPVTFTDAAVRIGNRLCEAAYNSSGSCNWIGSALGTLDPETGYPMPAVAALHGDVYGGTAGIALFLAELFSVTGESRHRDTALAAQRQALGALQANPDLYRPWAFYAGALGIVWSGHRVAALTSNDDLAGESEDLAREHIFVNGTSRAERPVDVMEGDAGAVLALLSRYRETLQTHAIAAAQDLGQTLLGVVGGHRPALTGFSHGAAGIGLALLELACATGDVELREAANELFAYEARCYDEEEGNWPDFRSEQTLRTSTSPSAPAVSGAMHSTPRRYMTAWCHGAAGIALSRLRAMAVDSEHASDYLAAARAGLAATDARLTQALEDPRADTCLCHGLCGMIDVLFVGAETLGDEVLRARATQALMRLVDRHAESIDWPSGDRGSFSPGLFVGLAGVGHVLLRFDHPERIASVLLPRW